MSKYDKTPVLFNVNVPLAVTQQQVDDIVTTALEGGITYWADACKVVDGDYRGAEFASEALSRGATLRIHDSVGDEEGKPRWINLTTAKLAKGVEAALKAHPHLIERFDDGFDGDAGEADTIVQFALFGKEIYG